MLGAMLVLSAAAAVGALAQNQTTVVIPLPPIPADKSTPVQQRLAFGRGQNSISVGWNTYAKIERPTVHYGTNHRALFQSASSHASVTYPTSRTWSNTVLITGLRPATTYYYKIDSTNSSIDSFTTARLAGDHTPFTAAAVIDMGLYGKDGLVVDPSEKHLIPRIAPELKHTTIDSLVNSSASYDFVFHPGDISYADNWMDANPAYAADSAKAYESIIERFFDQLSLVSRMKPYMVSPGNHEADCSEDPSYACAPGQKNFSSFINRFTGMFPTVTPSLPLLAEGGGASPSQEAVAARHRANAAKLANPPFWFSYDYGMAHFVMFDTETDLGSGIPGPEEKGGSSGLVEGPFGRVNQQINFLREDLASVDRRKTPWVIAAGHRPWYTTGNNCTECQRAFEGVLNEYGVDVGVFGHVHNLQVIKPITNNTVDPAGQNNPKSPWYINSGAAGQIEGLAKVSDGDKRPYVSWYNDTVFGWSRFQFKSPTTLTVQFVRSTDSAVIHQDTLYKKHDRRFFGQ